MIKRLAPDISTRIAAGEVIERPSSVAKELIENSLDAGAKSISLYTEQGGKSSFVIEDDGCGIPDIETATTDQILPLVKNELGLAFLPKAMAKEAIEHREILCIQLKDKIPKLSVCMMYDSRGPRSVSAQTFQKILLEEGE